MRNLINATVLSFFVLFTYITFGQALEQPDFLVQYGLDKKLHARALASHKKTLFIAASNGKIYEYSFKKESIKVIDSAVHIELRDIIASKKKIIALASGESSETISFDRKTYTSTHLSFENQFLDGIEISKKTIFMMGDPVDGKFNLLSSSDFGQTWTPIKNAPEAISGEAGFAASGTNLQMISDRIWLFASGGMDSQLYRTEDAGATWTDTNLGFPPCESCGAYSIEILPDKKTIIAVGGDYLKPNHRTGTCRISNDGGLTWHSPTNDLGGYRSNVIYHDRNLYACGTSGIDVSHDFGENWSPFTYGNYFTMTIFKHYLLASTTIGTVHFFNLKPKD